MGATERKYRERPRCGSRADSSKVLDCGGMFLQGSLADVCGEAVTAVGIRREKNL